MKKTQSRAKGAAMILFVLFFAFATSSLMFVLGQNIFSDVTDFNRLADGKQSFLTSESLTDDVVYRRVFETLSVDTVESLQLGNVIAYSTSTYDNVLDMYVINTSARAGKTIRKSHAELSIAAGSAFNYGLQAGNGGIDLDNGARVLGNIYSNGSVIGSNRSDILGDVVSAGPAGLVRDVHATGTVFANSIDDIQTDVAAYYNVDQHPTGPKKSNIPVGQRHTPAPNQATTSFPLSTTTIQEWKDSITNVIAATDPECISGTYTIDSSITLGYVKIECNVDIKDLGAPATVVTLTGPVWIAGNLSFTQGPEIRVHPSLGRRSVQMIVDKTSNRLTSSKISLNQSTQFTGSGDSRSYVMILSMNESASLGGPEIAIDLTNSANGSIIAYAEKGLVQIGNHANLKEITAHQINVGQNTDVVYETGLASLIFTSGPGGSYVIDDWQQNK